MKNKSPIYRLKLLNADFFPEPIYKDDIIIFSDKQEEIFKSYKDLQETVKSLEKHNIKYTLKVE